MSRISTPMTRGQVWANALFAALPVLAGVVIIGCMIAYVVVTMESDDDRHVREFLQQQNDQQKDLVLSGAKGKIVKDVHVDGRFFTLTMEDGSQIRVRGTKYNLKVLATTRPMPPSPEWP